MPKPIINGTLEAIKQPSEYQYDPQRGVTRVDRWEAAGPSGLYGLVATLGALGTAYNFTPSSAKSVLVATATGPENGQPEVATDTWQIVGNELQKSLFEHPASLAIEAAWPGTLGIVKRDVESYNRGEPLAAPAPNVAAVAAGAGKLFALLQRGTTHFGFAQYVLKHTTNASVAYDKNVSDTNVEKIYTTAQLLVEAQSATLWSFPLPGRLSAKINAIQAPTPVTDYLWGWRKVPSTETTAANNRIEITTEYVLEQWSTFIYGIVPP